jgi:hypothetical protein
MRQISFSLTTPQFRAHTKTVTRRVGWLDAEAGDVLMGIEKGQGIPKGGHVVKLGRIRLVSVRREPLRAITEEDCIKEGFPGWKPARFITMYCKANGGLDTQDCTRLEFEYLDPIGWEP